MHLDCFLKLFVFQKHLPFTCCTRFSGPFFEIHNPTTNLWKSPKTTELSCFFSTCHDIMVQKLSSVFHHPILKNMRSSGPGSFHQVWGGVGLWEKKHRTIHLVLGKLLLFPNPIYKYLKGAFWGYIIPLLQSPPFTKEIPTKKGGWTQTKIHGQKVCLIFFKNPEAAGTSKKSLFNRPHIIYRLNVWFKNSPNISVRFKNHLTSKTLEKFGKISAFFGGWEWGM